jgi:hypothetical protein
VRLEALNDSMVGEVGWSKWLHRTSAAETPNSGFQMATRDMNLTKMTVKRPQTVNTVNTLRSLQDHD